jgi:hypothetical protein
MDAAVFQYSQYRFARKLDDFNTIRNWAFAAVACSFERPHQKRNGSGSQTKERDLFHATQSLETSSYAFPAASRISDKSDLRS